MIRGRFSLFSDPPTRALRNAFSLLLLVAAALADTNRTHHITGIAHIAIRVSDLSTSLRFYQSLGFERAFEFTNDGVPTEEFLKINDRQFIELYPLSETDQRPGLMHVCFESDDLIALQRAYLEAGLNPPQIKRGGAGNDLFSLRRQDAAVIEFTQYQPASMHMKDAGLHLGANRIADRLADVIEPVSNPPADVAFYHQRLGFLSEGHRSRAEVRVPSTTPVHLGFTSPDKPLRLVFPVASVSQSKEAFRKGGISYADSNRAVMVKDPDGNELVFMDQP